MAQPGNFTPILLYGSSTPTNVPLAANLTNSATGSEIAINVADKNLFFKDSGGVVNTVPIRQSSASSNGWLSSTDWSTFNGKAPATSGTSLLYGNGAGGFSNVTIGSGISFAGGTLSATGSGGTVTSVAALTLGTTGTDLSSTVANGTTTPVITLNVPTASAANRGALSAADWSTFNGKQAALVSGTNIKTVGGVSLLGSGDVGTIGVGYGGTGTSTAFTAGSVVFAGASGVYSQNNSLFFWDNSNGRLGVGTAAPAVQGIDVWRDGIIRMSSALNAIGQLQFFNTGGSTENARIQGNLEIAANGGNLAFYTKLYSGSITEKMRIDGTGNVGIGCTPSAWGSGSGTLQIASYLGFYSNSPTNNYYSINSYFNGANDIYTSTNQAAQLRFAGNTWIFNQAASGTAGNAISWSEAMRIDSSGNLLVNTTSTVVGGKLSVSVDGTPGGFACTSAAGGVVLDLNRTGSTSGDVVYIRTSGGTLAGYITCPTATTTSYLSISDYRLKTDIEPLTGALDRVMKLKPCAYTWKANNIKSEGFIAHELQSIVPEAVSGIKDALNKDGSPKYQGVDAGSASLIAVLSAALQELNNKFDAYVASHP